MFERITATGDPAKDYPLLLEQLEALVSTEENCIANLANASALLYQSLPGINWVGFYLLENEELVLGPFQGLPACTRIPLGKGVSGAAAKMRKIQCVADVSKFEGHIACDAASRSELVIPLVKENRLLGVLDIDSPETGRFQSIDIEFLSRFAEITLRFFK